MKKVVGAMLVCISLALFNDNLVADIFVVIALGIGAELLISADRKENKK